MARTTGKTPGTRAGNVRVGIGGWTFAPWRGTFYPDTLVQRLELEYASRQLTAIEINGTFYRAQKPATYAKWRADTPDGFVFSLKAPRYVTDRRVLADAGPAISRFVQSGIAELGDRLGPINWQFPPHKAFEPDDFARFLESLPRELEGRPLRHVVEVRHPGFECLEFVELVRRHGVAIVFTDSPDYASFADLAADFAYARLMRSNAKRATGYTPAELNAWATRARVWASGGEPADLPRVAPSMLRAAPRDVYLYFIGAAKVRNPAAAMALIKRLQIPG